MKFLSAIATVCWVLIFINSLALYSAGVPATMTWADIFIREFCLAGLSLIVFCDEFDK